MLGQTTYPLTYSIWPSEGLIDILDVNGQRVVALSLEFLIKGHVLTWSYIVDAAQTCVCEIGSIFSSDGHLIDSHSKPSAGVYFYKRADNTAAACTPKIGPRFHYKHRGPTPGSESGTMSASSASQMSGNQASFRNDLLIRDGWCIISEEKSAVACHILPQSRPEYYIEVLGYIPSTLHDVSYGVLLTSTLHHSFDKGEFGFRADIDDPSTLVVHVFHNPDMAKYHGKKIARSRFRAKGVYELPRLDLLDFHYRQCIIKHCRGYAFFPESDNAYN